MSAPAAPRPARRRSRGETSTAELAVRDLLLHDWSDGRPNVPVHDPRPVIAEAASDTRGAAAHYLRRARTTDRGNARELGLGRADTIRREGELLLEWADSAGRLLTSTLTESIQFEQGEHQGFHDFDSDRWFKLTLPGCAGWTLAAHDPVPGVRGAIATRLALPSEYLERIRLANECFGDDLRFHGVVSSNTGWQLVISQRHIPGRPPTEDEVASFFRANQFRAVSMRVYYRARDNVLVGDAHVGNLKRIHTGDVLPFDLLICQPDAALRACVEAPAELEF